MSKNPQYYANSLWAYNWYEIQTTLSTNHTKNQIYNPFKTPLQIKNEFIKDKQHTTKSPNLYKPALGQFVVENQ